MPYETKEQRDKIKNITQKLWDTYNLTKKLTFVTLHEKFPKEKLLSHLDVDCKKIRDLRNEERRNKRTNISIEKTEGDSEVEDDIDSRKKSQKEIVKLHRVIKDLENDKEESDFRSEKFEKQVIGLKFDIFKHEEDKKDLQKRIDELGSTVSSLTKNINKKSSQIDQLNLKNIEQEDNIREIRSELRIVKRDFTDEVLLQKSLNSNYENEIEILNVKVNNLTNDNIVMKEKIHSYELITNRLQKMSEENYINNNIHKIEINNAKIQNENLIQENQSIKESFEKIQISFEKLKVDNKNTQENFDRLKTKYRNLKKDNIDIRDNIDKLNAEKTLLNKTFSDQTCISKFYMRKIDSLPENIRVKYFPEKIKYK